MALNAAPDTTLAYRANLNIAAAVVAKLGTGASDSLISRVINDVRASHPVAQLASAGSMAVVIGAVDTAIASSAEAGKPQNLYDANAARAAQQAGAPTSWASLGGGDRPTDPFQRLAALRDREAARDGGGSSGSDCRSSSSARYDGIVSDWGSARGLAITRNYALGNDMGWATKDADLMRMGTPALKALNEAGLKGDGYQALRSPKSLSFDNPTIVKGADYMKRNKLNYDEAAKAMGDVQNLKGQPKELLDEHRDAAKGVLTSTPQNQDERRQRLRHSGEKMIEHDPNARGTIEKELRALGIQQKKELKLKAGLGSPTGPTPSAPTDNSAKAASRLTKQKVAEAQNASADAKARAQAALSL